MVWIAACGDELIPPLPSPEPALTGLEVTGGRELNPAFDPEVSRYSVVATPDSASLTVRALVAPGGSIERNGIEVQIGASYPSGAVPGTTIELEVRNSAGAARQITILYLPADFPELRVTRPRDEMAPGLTYLTFGTWLTIVDDRGVPVFYRQESGRVFDFKLHPTGERSYGLRTGEGNEFGRPQNEIVLLDDGFHEIARLTTVGLNHTDFHDFLLRENGNRVFIAYHGSRRDMTAMGGTADQVVEESVVQEVTPDGDVVFEWTSWGHIPTSEALRDWADYAHVNSLFLDDAGDFIISARGVSQVLKLDRASGGVVWKLGGHSNEFAFVDDPFAHLCGQHTATLVRSGNLLIFDNGQLCWPPSTDRGELTRVAEYRLDESARTATLVWSYSHEDRYTVSQGSAQRLDDGNTLIGWGRGPAMAATEVDRGGVVVWELQATSDGSPAVTYRAFRGSR